MIEFLVYMAIFDLVLIAAIKIFLEIGTSIYNSPFIESLRKKIDAFSKDRQAHR